MRIEISNSFFYSTEKLLKKDFYLTINKEKFIKKIYEILKEDSIVNIEFSSIHWDFIKKKFQGIYLCEDNVVVYFAQLLNIQGKTRSRNTYLSQNYLSAYNFANNKNARIIISANPYDFFKKPNLAKSIIFFLDLAFTNGTIISKSINHSNFKKINLDTFLKTKKDLKSQNSKNDSTFIKYFVEYDEIYIYGRLEGASGNETILNCIFLINICKNDHPNIKLHFFDISQNSYSKNHLDRVKKFGIIIEDARNNENNLENSLEKDIDNFEEDKFLKRNQPTFIRNILIKYMKESFFNANKCLACDYAFGSNLIGAHIYRYADIKKDLLQKKITVSEAAHLIVSGDNGFLLCPNQDKEFECGMIIFDLDKKTFIANRNKLSDDECKTINEKIKMKELNDTFIVEEFISNVKKHLERIQYKSE